MGAHLIPPWDWTVKVWSSVLGYGSIGFWVFAQVPQILENVRLQSCEGLALPFLLNWFIGDLCNLIGCLLTDQRAFQTWTATYFCLMDIGLTSQYFYYTNIVRKHKIEASRSRSRSRSRIQGPRDTTVSVHSQARLRQSASRSTRASAERSPELQLSLPSSNGIPSSFSPRQRPRLPSNRHSSYQDDNDGEQGHQNREAGGSGFTVRPHRDGSMAALQEAAMDVARAAAKVERSRSRPTGSKNSSLERSSGLAKLAPSLRRGPSARKERYEMDMDEAGMIGSFHSDVSSASAHSSGSGQDGHAGAKAWRGSRKGKEKSMAPEGDLEGLPSPAMSPEMLSYRGRTLQRPHNDQDEQDDDAHSPHLRNIAEEMEDDISQVKVRKKLKNESRSRSVLRGPGERAAGVVFMGVFALVGWGGVRSGEQPFGKGMMAWEGSVLAESSLPTWTSAKEQYNRHTLASRGEGHIQLVEVAAPTLHKDRDQPKHYPEKPDVQRIIGRSSAWICTTLYLTSRLPQIWKNFERKSTEGLSVLLFIFAFAGNFTYVLSILLNPTGDADPAETAHYLLEALPYLLGSGGTLVFDLTIMLQTYLYGTNHPQQDAIEEERNHSIASRSRNRQAYSPSDDERQPLIKERSHDAAMLHALQNAGHTDKTVGQDVAIPRDRETLESGESTPRPGRA